MNAANMQALHVELLEWRETMDGTAFKPMKTGHALMWANTEVGEAQQAYLGSLGIYARNHDDHDEQVFEELADVALDLFSALPPGYSWDSAPAWPMFSSLEEALCWLAEIVGPLANKFRLWEYVPVVWLRDAGSALWIIAATPGMDLPGELRKRMARIAAKYGKQV